MRYGQKNGDGPTAGKKATVYEIAMPDGSIVKKRVFRDDMGDTLIATALRHNGKILAVVWPGVPEWEGDFGQLVARKV